MSESSATDELDRIISATADYYWMRPQYLQQDSQHKILRLARRIVAYHTEKRGVRPLRVVRERICVSDRTIRRAHRQIALGIENGRQSREVLDALSVERRMP